MADICNDNRFEIIVRAKKALLEGTNIETDEDEMKVIDNILFRCWQMGWLDRYDTADTPQTEDLLITEYPQEGEVTIVGNGSNTAVVMGYDEYKAMQTESTGAPIGDYRDGVGAWQTDCDDRYALRTDSGEVVAYACPLGCEQTDCGWK